MQDLLRVHEFGGNVYVVREAGDAREYAGMVNGRLVWHPCQEGAVFGDEIKAFSTHNEWRTLATGSEHVLPRLFTIFPELRRAS